MYLHIGYILVYKGIAPGAHIIEAGTGSGSLTTALAFTVGSAGRVSSYDVRPEMQNLARKNLERAGLSDRVTFIVRDIAEGFDEQGADAIFLDLPNPQDYLAQAHQAIKPGGFLGSILPTTNQVSILLTALQPNLRLVEVCEIMLRFYKAVAQRLRPTDRMVAHTGYLIFARSILRPEPEFLNQVEDTSAEQESPGQSV
jgi:tRNA (adenine57-N1/adenine58-N1)-methyltransferase